MARMALLLAGLPVEIPGQTVNVCAAQGFRQSQARRRPSAAEEGDCFIAGDVRV